MKSSILFVLPTDILGGAENNLRIIAEYYVKNDHNVKIVFLKKSISNSWNYLNYYENCSLIFLPIKREIFGIFHLFKFLILNKKYDYVFSSHTHINGYTGVLRFLHVLKTSKLIVRESTVIFDRFRGAKLLFFKACYYFGYPNVDLVICQTEIMRDKLLYHIGFIGKKTLVIPNPVDIDEINIKAKSKIEDIILASDFIVTAGRLIKLKGFDILIQAFKNISQLNNNLKLVILGEGEERENLTNIIRTLNLQNKVILKGRVSNVYPYFKNAKCCVVSSLVEGFPNVLLQMMSQNTNIVSTKCAGEIDEIKGISLSEVNNVQSLKNEILNVLNKNNNHHRVFFDKELENRSVSSFISKINFYLK